MTQGLRGRPAHVCRFAIGLLVVASTIGCTSTGKRTSEPLPPLPTPRVSSGPASPTGQAKAVSLPTQPVGTTTRTSPSTPTNFSGVGANLDTQQTQTKTRSVDPPLQPIASPVIHQNPAAMTPIVTPTSPAPISLPTPPAALEIKAPTIEPTAPAPPRSTGVVSIRPPEPIGASSTPTMPEPIIVPSPLPPGTK